MVQRPLRHLVRQRQHPQELARLYASANSCRRTALACKAQQDSRVQRMAFLPSLIHCSAVPRPFVELHHPHVGAAQVGRDEADAGIELALVPVNLGHHSTGSDPARGLIVEAGVGHDRLLGRSPHRPRQQVFDPPLQHLVGRQADRVADALVLQQFVDLRLGECRIGAKVEIAAPARGSGRSPAPAPDASPRHGRRGPRARGSAPGHHAD